MARGRGLGSVLAVVAAAAGGAARLAGHLAAEHGTGGGGLVLHAGVGDGAGEEPGLGARVLLQDDLGRGHPLTQLQQLLAPGNRGLISLLRYCQIKCEKHRSCQIAPHSD